VTPLGAGHFWIVRQLTNYLLNPARRRHYAPPTDATPDIPEPPTNIPHLSHSSLPHRPALSSPSPTLSPYLPPSLIDSSESTPFSLVSFVPHLPLLTMSSQRYERVRTPPTSPRPSPRHQAPYQNQLVVHNTNNPYQVAEHDESSPVTPRVPNSPPPSFRSRDSSITSRRNQAVDPTLADTFDADGADSDEENDGDDRQRLMRGVQASPVAETAPSLPAVAEAPIQRIERRPTQLPVFAPTSTRIYGGGSGSDGVFANLAAKPEPGEKMEEHPPVSYDRIVSITVSGFLG
jgi:hypothetical protein